MHGIKPKVPKGGGSAFANHSLHEVLNPPGSA
jgi:hypothetical protein